MQARSHAISSDWSHWRQCHGLPSDWAILGSKSSSITDPSESTLTSTSESTCQWSQYHSFPSDRATAKSSSITNTSEPTLTSPSTWTCFATSSFIPVRTSTAYPPLACTISGHLSWTTPPCCFIIFTYCSYANPFRGCCCPAHDPHHTEPISDSPKHFRSLEGILISAVL